MRADAPSPRALRPLCVARSFLHVRWGAGEGAAERCEPLAPAQRIPTCCGTPAAGFEVWNWWPTGRCGRGGWFGSLAVLARTAVVAPVDETEDVASFLVFDLRAGRSADRGFHTPP